MMRRFQVTIGVCLLVLVTCIWLGDGAPVNGIWSGMASRGTADRGFSVYDVYDVQKQIGSIGDDLKKIITNLVGTTQVVYWKYPKSRFSLKKAKPPVQHHNGKRKKKALHEDYDDFIAIDTWGFFR